MNHQMQLGDPSTQENHEQKLVKFNNFGVDNHQHTEATIFSYAYALQNSS